MDLRLPLSHSLIKASSLVSTWFRQYLIEKDFIEIHSPKLIEGVSEGGSEVFITDYFGRPACLAQSPQLFKQMAVLSDFLKVFEVGPVFRAENSNTHRHLCEFTGLDLETSINSSYLEIIDLVTDLLMFIFNNLEKSSSLNLIYSHFETFPIKYSKTSKILITYEEASELLRSSGSPHSFPDDFSLEQEKLLGSIMKEKYFSDFYIIHQYPTCLRPLYTKPCDFDSRYSESFDFFIRGEEIASGSRRISNYQELLDSVASRKVDPKSIQFYLECFKYGSPDHGGCGLGLERLVMLYFGVNNIRFTSMFPRDPKRLVP
jgi:aspartyl-tRNA synthetase